MLKSKNLGMILIGLVMLNLGCGTSRNIDTTMLKSHVSLDKGTYAHGDNIILSTSLENESEYDLAISDFRVIVRNISDPSHDALLDTILHAQLEFDALSQLEIQDTLSGIISADTEKRGYGIYLKYAIEGQDVEERYETFFRVINEDEITTFDIAKDEYNGIPIFQLDGGMSAEYVVEKSLENLTGGISHSWKVNAPGSGPNHVLGTPNFLAKSVERTVDLYNTSLGRNTPLETVIIAPGIPSIPYISLALDAPVLPLHFLVSVNTVKEVQSILTTAENSGIDGYATLSHDPSVPYAVSWIKLLSMPHAYMDFIKDHAVENVIIIGATGVNGGETKAKRLLFDSDHDVAEGSYQKGDIFIMYPGTSPNDVATLNEKIIDLDDFEQQDNFVRIADWESGINPNQIENFSKDSKSIGDISVSTILAEDLTNLYNLGTFCSLALMSKNKDEMNNPKGVIFNPYLLSHPAYEMQKGYIPMLYWQLVGANYTVDRMEKTALEGFKHYFPKTNFKNLKLWLNSTRNFGASWSAKGLKDELLKRGYSKLIEGNYAVDEVWNPDDGMLSPCELIYNEVKSDYPDFKVRNTLLQHLNLQDMKKMSDTFGGFQVNTIID
ncbi:hypothetical protein [Flagellimonas sp.]|uniref:hypothetical protein n=1 Tax=Flagellimonas sp. TaxID=2058762 RepID=UPI003B50B108